MNIKNAKATYIFRIVQDYTPQKKKKKKKKPKHHARFVKMHCDLYPSIAQQKKKYERNMWSVLVAREGLNNSKENFLERHTFEIQVKRDSSAHVKQSES